jgi:hypothetical protein
MEEFTLVADSDGIYKLVHWAESDDILSRECEPRCSLVQRF